MTKITLTYKIAHDWNLNNILTAYQRLLQRAIDEIWNNTVWKERKVKYRIL